MKALDHVIDRAVLRWPSANARAWLCDFLRSASESDDVLAVVAMGSAVRPSVESADLDLLAIIRDGSELVARSPIEIDLRSRQLGAAEAELESGGDLVSWAVRYGVPLYDPESVWAGLCESWGGRLRLPDPEVAEDRASRMAGTVHRLREVGDEAAANEIEVSMLTHRARAALSRAGVFPASRPELPRQLRGAGKDALAAALERALRERARLEAEGVAT
jgi:hypothetical protein